MPKRASRVYVKGRECPFLFPVYVFVSCVRRSLLSRRCGSNTLQFPTRLISTPLQCTLFRCPHVFLSRTAHLRGSLEACLHKLGGLVVPRLSPLGQPVARFPYQTKLRRGRVQNQGRLMDVLCFDGVKRRISTSKIHTAGVLRSDWQRRCDTYTPLTYSCVSEITRPGDPSSPRVCAPSLREPN